jgi:hypothetical protein
LIVIVVLRLLMSVFVLMMRAVALVVLSVVAAVMRFMRLGGMSSR